MGLLVPPLGTDWVSTETILRNADDGNKIVRFKFIKLWVKPQHDLLVASFFYFKIQKGVFRDFTVRPKYDGTSNGVEC